MQVRRCFEPRLPRIRFYTRRKCAIRLIGYLRSLQAFGHTQGALIRVRKAIASIQRLWKDTVLIRQQQQKLFLEQVLVFEGRLLRSNQIRCDSPL
jgi:hypothetical protein